LNILIIEDNPSHLKLAHLVLSSAGYNVDSAGAAEHAFSAIKSSKPELIFLDLELPGMDGLAFVRRIKADPETRDIHIVAVTAYSDRFTRADALAAGCAAYITKPINTRTLPDQLAALVK
jgi:CheY-like chemotaxis protein